LRIGFIAFAAALITFGLSGMAFAFHSGGVAECTGCHALHEAASASNLLVQSDASSTCLSCHGASGASSYHIATPDADMPVGTPPGNRTPGGDFGWLKKGYQWVPRTGSTSNSLAENHGHNVVAGDFGYIVDAVNETAPGGDMLSTELACTSCHDQHGKLRRSGTDAAPVWGVNQAAIIGSGSYYNSVEPAAGQAVGAYRLLRGTGSLPSTTAGNKMFTTIFNASAPSTYNRTEAVTPTRVGYGAGTTDWCATCHPDMLSATSTHTHPVNQGLGATVTANYNAYKGSGDMTGVVATSFDSLVPFQTGVETNYTVLKGLANPASATIGQGPISTDRVMCLSCHRAHATGWDYMLRFNVEGNEFIAVDGVWPGTDSPSTIANQAKYAQGRTVAETTKAYNDTTMHYGSYQRSLCNKCHAKD